MHDDIENRSVLNVQQFNAILFKFMFGALCVKIGDPDESSNNFGPQFHAFMEMIKVHFKNLCTKF